MMPLHYLSRYEEALEIIDRIFPKVFRRNRLLWIVLTVFFVLFIFVNIMNFFSNRYSDSGDTSTEKSAIPGKKKFFGLNVGSKSPPPEWYDSRRDQGTELTHLWVLHAEKSRFLYSILGTKCAQILNLHWINIVKEMDITWGKLEFLVIEKRCFFRLMSHLIDIWLYHSNLIENSQVLWNIHLKY